MTPAARVDQTVGARPFAAYAMVGLTVVPGARQKALARIGLDPWREQDLRADPQA
jgi:hypothetical protein